MTRVTLEDVAKKTGVSSKTVSRVLNGEPNVSKRTAELVQAAIADLNYVPNSAARSLSSGKSLALGLVIGWSVNSPYSSTLIEEALEAGNRQGYNLALYSVADGTSKRIIDAYRGRQVDGIILDTNAAEDESLMHQLEVLKVPTIVIHPNHRRPQAPVSHIQIDNRRGAQMAVEHLLSLGHRCIGYISHETGLTHLDERRIGYSQALEAAGIVPDPAWVWITTGPSRDPSRISALAGVPFQSGFQGATELLTAQKCLTALFASTDEFAMGALAAVWNLGLRVPDDVSIVGFDDIIYANMVAPPLTTIHQPIDEIISLAVKHLIATIKNPDTPPIDIVMPTNLVVRKSCKALVHPQGQSANGTHSRSVDTADVAPTF